MSTTSRRLKGALPVCLAATVLGGALVTVRSGDAQAGGGNRGPHSVTVISGDGMAAAHREAARQRRFRAAAALTAARIRLAVVPEQTVRRRQIVQVCSAARILTALGVRVQVVQPERPWPRDRTLRLAAPAGGGRLADLAVLTAVPRTTPGWSAVADRVFGFRPRTAGPPEPVAGDPLRCAVAVRFRTDAGDLAGPPPTPAGVVAVRGLVVEVRLLPAEEQSPVRRAEPSAA